MLGSTLLRGVLRNSNLMLDHFHQAHGSRRARTMYTPDTAKVVVPLEKTVNNIHLVKVYVAAR